MGLKEQIEKLNPYGRRVGKYKPLKFLQIKQKAAGNPAAFSLLFRYKKVDRFHSESVNLSWHGLTKKIFQIRKMPG